MLKKILVFGMLVGSMLFGGPFEDVDAKYKNQMSTMRSGFAHLGVKGMKAMSSKDFFDKAGSDEMEAVRILGREGSKASGGIGLGNLRDNVIKLTKENNDVRKYKELHEDLASWYCKYLNDELPKAYRIKCGWLSSGMSSEEFKEKWYDNYYKPYKDEQDRLNQIRREQEEKEKQEAMDLADTANALRRDVVELCQSKFTRDNESSYVSRSGVYHGEWRCPMYEEGEQCRTEKYREDINSHKSKGHTLCMLYEEMTGVDSYSYILITKDITANPNLYPAGTLEMFKEYNDKGSEVRLGWNDGKDRLNDAISYYKESLNIINNTEGFHLMDMVKEEKPKQQENTNTIRDLLTGKVDYDPTTNTVTPIEAKKPFNKQEGIDKISKVENVMKEKVNALSHRIEVLQKENTDSSRYKATQLLSEGKTLMNRYDILGKNLKAKYSDITEDYVKDYLEESHRIIEEIDRLMERN